MIKSDTLRVQRQQRIPKRIIRPGSRFKAHFGGRIAFIDPSALEPSP